MMPLSALVLFSGGQDSTTCLAWALDRFENVETVGFDYGQRHRVELDCRAPILASIRAGFPRWASKLGEDRVIDLGLIGEISDTALTSDVAIRMQANGLPNTFVPGRNLLFFTVAATLADARAVIALAREKKLLVQGGFMWRYHPGFRAIFEAVRQGWLGDVYLVRGFISNSLPAARRAEWAEFSGGSMFELGSHLIDAAVRVLGRPKTITPFVARHGKFDDTLRDNNLAVLEFDRARAVLFNTALQAGSTPQRSFEVLGTKGTATLAPIEPGKLIFNLTDAAGPYKKGPQEISFPAYKRYVDDFTELAAAVRGEQPLTVSLDEELLVAETVLRACGMS